MNSDNTKLAQFYRSIIKRSIDEDNKRINEIRCCNHLFVKLRDFEPEITTSIIECVHCGVTNKFYDLELTKMKYPKSLELNFLTKFHPVNVQYRDITIESMMMNEVLSKGISLISDKVLRSDHPGVLYDIARFLEEDATPDELFEIMNELNKLETSDEKNKINSIFDCKNLIERYLNSLEEKTYKKEL